MVHLGDITKINGAEIETVDCIIGGSPCQDLSVAGKRAGLAGKRSGLFMEQIRIVKEMRDADRRRRGTDFNVRPRFMVWENVPGAFSSNKGQDFAAVLEETVRIVCPEAPDLPVPRGGGGRQADASTMQWADGQLLGDYTTRSFGESPREENVLRFSQISEGCPHPKYNLSAKACAGILRRAERRGKILPPELKAALERQAGLSSTTRGGQQITVSEDGILPTLRAETHGNLPCVIQEPKTYFIQGNCIDRADNAGCNGRGWNDEVCYTLNTIDRPAVYESEAEPIMIEMTSTKNTIITDGISPTLTARMGTGGNQVNCVFYAMQGFGDYKESDVGSSCKARDYKDNTDLVMTVDCRNGTESEINGTLQAKPNGGLSLNTNIVCRQGNTVRRITPLECERMQGYPDGWTDIGEWTDSKGKKHQSTDTNRYKALGNSIAAPFWFYLLRRISAEYERPATMGSLFDGIGGFPLCWEKCNGKGTARWASEIEEFPIAVTKAHFPEQ